MLFAQDISQQDVVELRTFVFFRHPVKVFNPKSALLRYANLLTVLLVFILLQMHYVFTYSHADVRGHPLPPPPQVITRSTSTSLPPWLCRITRGLILLVLLKGVLNFLTNSQKSFQKNVQKIFQK